jgi:hypothetical protein
VVTFSVCCGTADDNRGTAVSTVVAGGGGGSGDSTGSDCSGDPLIDDTTATENVAETV